MKRNENLQQLGSMIEPDPEPYFESWLEQSLRLPVIVVPHDANFIKAWISTVYTHVPNIPGNYSELMQEQWLHFLQNVVVKKRAKTRHSLEYNEARWNQLMQISHLIRVPLMKTCNLKEEDKNKKDTYLVVISIGQQNQNVNRQSSNEDAANQARKQILQSCVLLHAALEQKSKFVVVAKQELASLYQINSTFSECGSLGTFSSSKNMNTRDFCEHSWKVIPQYYRHRCSFSDHAPTIVDFLDDCLFAGWVRTHVPNMDLLADVMFQLSHNLPPPCPIVHDSTEEELHHFVHENHAQLWVQSKHDVYVQIDMIGIAHFIQSVFALVPVPLVSRHVYSNPVTSTSIVHKPAVVQVLSPKMVMDEEVTSSNDVHCVVCLGNRAIFAFTPCGHLCVCNECLHGLQAHNNNCHGETKCPLCKQVSTNTVRIFASRGNDKLPSRLSSSTLSNVNEESIG